MIDILTLNYNDSKTTIDFVESIKNYSCIRHILIVDNHSTDESFEKISTYCSGRNVIVVQTEKNGGYGAGNNFGVRYLQHNFGSEYILICNPDVIVSEDTILELKTFLKKNEVYAIAAPAMIIPRKGIRYCALKNPSFFSFLMSVELLYSSFFSPLYLNISNLKGEKNVNVFSVAGSLFMIDARKFLEEEIYDENMFLYFEEFVLGKKCQKKNYKVALLPHLLFIHNHSVSISKTYRSVVNKHRVYLRSYRYVIRKYFNANLFICGISYVISAISIVEVFAWSNIKRILGKKCV